MSLNYPCILSVLSHLHPNHRLELLQKTPSLRTPNKLIPLRVDKLEISRCKIVIQDMIYKVGIVRHYPGDVTPPEWIRRENEDGGVPYDVGAFGDVENPNVRFRNHQDREPSIEEAMEKEEAEKELETVKEKESKRARELQTTIRNYNEQMALSKLEFIEYVQLTIENSSTGTRTFQRVNYETPIHVAMNYITNFLLEGRTIYTKELILSQKVILPRTLSIKVERDFEVEVRDHQIVSIAFPSHGVVFRNFFNMEIRFRTIGHRIIFHVEGKEKIVETLSKMATNSEDMAKLIRMELPLKIRYEAMGIGNGDIRVEHIRDEYYSISIGANWKASLELALPYQAYVNFMRIIFDHQV